MPWAKFFREEGAWWMALMGWACGWVTAQKASWIPPVIAVGAMILMMAGPGIRSSRHLWRHDRSKAVRVLIVSLSAAILPASAFVWLAAHAQDRLWFMIAGALFLLYALIIILGQERSPLSRIAGVIAITTMAPLTYAATTDRWDRTALVLWSALGSYFLLGAIFVMARFRRSRPALWAVRITTPLAATGLALWTIWILSLPLAILTLRSWLYRPAEHKLDPRTIGHYELIFGTVATALIAIGILLRQPA